MKKVILIDDEPLAISIIRDYLRPYSELEIVAECLNGFEGLKAIQNHQPDLIFLDIQMPKINGFEMLELIERPPAVIFCTAYDEYALKAFESNAVDYLLKPFTQERFEKAVKKWINIDLIPKNVASPLPLLEKMAPMEGVNRLVVKSGNNIRIIPFDEIRYIEAYDDYIKIHVEGDCFLKKMTMQKAEEYLGSEKFTRIHRSFIVKISEITRIEPLGKDQYTAILRLQDSVPLSKSGYMRLKNVLGM